MTELPQTLSDAFQRFTESNSPLFSWHRDLLNHPDHIRFLVIAFFVGAIIGLGLNLYRDHIRNESLTFEGFPLMLIPTLIGGVSAVLVYLFIVPLVYAVVIMGVLSFIAFVVWDGYKVSKDAFWRVFKPASIGILIWVVIFSVSGFMVWWYRADWQAVEFSLNQQLITSTVCLTLFLSLMFGSLRHFLYEDESRMVSSSWWLTAVRYLHVNLFWGFWRPVQDLATDLSAGYIADQLATVNAEHEWKANGYRFQIDRLGKDAEQRTKKSSELVGKLKRGIANRDIELERLREANKKLTDRVGTLSTEVTTLNEQNGELHQQWIDALQNTGVVDDGVVDLDDLFTDED